MKRMTKEQYRIAMKELKGLVELDPAADSPDGIQLKKLALSIEYYEKAHFRFPQPTREGRHQLKTGITQGSGE